MPRGDGTGPMGTGAMTGRGAGYCVGAGAPGYNRMGFGLNGGQGLGGGRRRVGLGLGGRRGRYLAPNAAMASAVAPLTSDPAQEQQLLERQAGPLQAELGQIKKRLDQLATANKA